MNYRWHPEALGDLDEAYAFYWKEDPRLEERLASYVGLAVDSVVAGPEMWPIVKEPVRRCLVDVFPYSLLYVVLERYILILAVAHQSRHPDYWLHRLDEQV
jgi:toxin ParE1/3/4